MSNLTDLILFSLNKHTTILPKMSRRPVQTMKHCCDNPTEKLVDQLLFFSSGFWVKDFGWSSKTENHSWQ